MNGYLSRHGYLICLNESLHQESLRRVYYRNPSARIVLFMNETPSVIETIFNLAWNQYRLLNIMIASLDGKVYMNNPYTSTLIFVSSKDIIDATALSLTTNLQHSPLRINKFYGIQLCDPKYDEKNGGYIAVCGEIFDVLKRSLNFTEEFVQPEIADFGYVLSNGSFIGALGEIEYDRADISVVMRLILNFNTSRNIYFLQPLFDIHYQFVIPIDFYPVEFEVLPHKFMDTSVMILTSLIMTAFILLHYLSDQVSNAVKANFSKTILIYIGSYLNAAMNFKPFNLSTRVLYSLVLLMTLIVSNTYQGSLITQLNKNEENANIKTLSQFIDSGLQVRVPSGVDQYILNFHEFPKNSVQSRLIRKMEVTEVSSEVQIHYAAVERTAGIMCMNHFFPYYESKFLSNKSGKATITAIPDYPYSYFMSLIIQKRSPYIERMNYINLKASEAALLLHQYNLGLVRMKLSAIRRVRDGLIPDIDRTKLIGMSEMMSFFICFLVALGISFTTFLGELFVLKKDKEVRVDKFESMLKNHDRKDCKICHLKNLGKQNRKFNKLWK